MKNTILVVDDEKSICESIKVVLGDNYKVISANSISEAREKLEHHKIDLIILDYWFSGKLDDGLDFLKEIRAKTTKLPIIFITAFGSEKTLENALKHENVYYLRKLFNNEDLLNKIRHILYNEPIDLGDSEKYEIKDKNKVLVNNIIEFVKENYTQHITTQSIAKFFGQDELYLNEIMERNLGMNVKEYMDNYRIKKGKDLLDQRDQSVVKICQRVGISRNTFYKLFHKYTGKSVKEYQKHKRKK